MPEPCHDCGRDAEFVCTENGVQFRLCGVCAARHTGISNFAALARAFQLPRQDRQACPYCGTTREDADASGLFGCPVCYDAFPELVEKMSPQSSFF